MTKYIFPLCLFFLALAVRLPALGQFLTVDEPDWLDRSRHFTAGLLFSDYACPALEKDGRDFATTGWGCTFHTVHPGVTTMWAGGVGLIGYYIYAIRPTGVDLRTFLTSPLTQGGQRGVDPALIAPMRLPLVLFAALYVVLFYFLAARLLSPPVAAVAAIFIALDPFHIGLSRVLHQDMLTASFMSLAWLMLLGYWQQNWSRQWLILAAICSGLACLSKPIGWFMPIYYIIGLIVKVIKRRAEGQKEEIFAPFIIFALFFAFAFTLFPAMLVMPLTVLQTIFSVSADYATSGHINGHYFFGAIVDDPGPLFYPLTWLWRTSPLVLLGLICWLIGEIWGRERAKAKEYQISAFFRTLSRSHLALIVILLLLFETASSKKMDRYFLPAYPLIDLLAAQGLIWLGEMGTRKIRNRANNRENFAPFALQFGFFAVIFVSFAFPPFAFAPYYFTYYNPLLGGAPMAAQMITIFGWGEGMDKAARFLNEQPHAEFLRVVSGYEDTLAPFFKGQIDHTFDTRRQITADYNIYYINQWQRELYNPDVWHYFQRHATPVHRVTFQGLDYVLLYQRPISQVVPSEGNSLPNTNTFGYNITVGGQLTLLWQNLGVTEPIWASLTPSRGGETTWTPCLLDPAFVLEAATPAAILASQCDFAPSQNSRPSRSGLYDLQFGLGQANAIVPSPFAAGRLALSVDPDGHFAPISLAEAMPRLLQESLPATAKPLNLSLGEWVRLRGYEVKSGNLVLYWQAQRPLNFQELPPILQLRLATTTMPLIPSAFATTTLQLGQVIPLSYTLSILPPLQICIMADSPEPVGCLNITP